MLIKELMENVYDVIELHQEEKTISSADLIFIDDNTCLTDAWVLHGKRVGKKVDAFNDIPSFQSMLMHYKKDIPIYIDADLNTYISGAELARDLYSQGFINLYLSTGYSADSFQEMSWIKAIIGKEPPF